MTAEGSPQSATTAAELQALIDGGYTIYTSHNFQEFAAQTYTGTLSTGQATLTAWIFELATVADSQALHGDEQVQTGNCQTLQGIGEMERLCFGLGSQTIQFQRSKYWVRLFIDNSSPDARGILELVGAHIDQKIIG